MGPLNRQMRLGAWLGGMLLPIAGCYHYRPQPLLPPARETQYRSRNFADPGLKEFTDAQNVGKPLSWPPKELGLETLTLVALYFHPDLNVARARLEASEAAVITASTKPNPTISGDAGYTNAAPAPYVLRFGLDWILSGDPGREIEGRMAIVILGGLATSTALNLLVLPSLALRFGHFTSEGARTE
jgi:hypothetical protein